MATRVTMEANPVQALRTALDSSNVAMLGSGPISSAAAPAEKLPNVSGSPRPWQAPSRSPPMPGACQRIS